MPPTAETAATTTTQNHIHANNAARDRTPRSGPIRGWHGWVPLVVLPILVLLLVPATWPAWALMWTLSVAIFAGCKWLTYRRRVRSADTENAPLWKHLAYLFTWPGLDAAGFLRPTPADFQKPTVREWGFAIAKTVAGFVVLFGLARLAPAEVSYLAGWVGMTGIILVLHFGGFHCLSCWWRAFGIEAKPLMNAPLSSSSISEFWGSRWNTAFRDLTHRFLFRPLTVRFGAGRAVWLGFLFSGVVHELVITVPARSGYGGPTLFFLLQAGALFLERSPAGRAAGLGAGLRGRLFTMFSLIAPAPLLFAPPFVDNVVLPFLRAIRAV